MISVADAKKIILENTDIISPARMSLEKAAGLVLADDLLCCHRHTSLQPIINGWVCIVIQRMAKISKTQNGWYCCRGQ